MALFRVTAHGDSMFFYANTLEEAQQKFRVLAGEVPCVEWEQVEEKDENE